MSFYNQSEHEKTVTCPHCGQPKTIKNRPGSVKVICTMCRREYLVSIRNEGHRVEVLKVSHE